MERVYYIHGAGASPASFNWLHDKLPSHEAHFLHYAVSESISDVLARAQHEIEDIDAPLTIIGHSLGGMIATGLTDLPQVQRIVTICAPFSGIASATLLRWFSPSVLFDDLDPHGATVRRLRAHAIECPHLAIVGTSGLPFPRDANDGVVSVQSQTALDGPEYCRLPFNHFEVLLVNETARLIAAFHDVTVDLH